MLEGFDRLNEFLLLDLGLGLKRHFGGGFLRIERDSGFRGIIVTIVSTTVAQNQFLILLVQFSDLLPLTRNDFLVPQIIILVLPQCLLQLVHRLLLALKLTPQLINMVGHLFALYL